MERTPRTRRKRGQLTTPAATRARWTATGPQPFQQERTCPRSQAKQQPPQSTASKLPRPHEAVAVAAQNRRARRERRRNQLGLSTAPDGWGTLGPRLRGGLARPPETLRHRPGPKDFAEETLLQPLWAWGRRPRGMAGERSAGPS